MKTGEILLLLAMQAAVVFAPSHPEESPSYNLFSPELIAAYIIIGGILYWLIYRRMKSKGKSKY